MNLSDEAQMGPVACGALAAWSTTSPSWLRLSSRIVLSPSETRRKTWALSSSPRLTWLARHARDGRYWLVALFLLLVSVETYFDTAGTFQFDSRTGYYDSLDYYDTLAAAFLSGQLYLKTVPDPELLALPNPYDPSKNEKFRLHDASLYNGRYYLYFVRRRRCFTLPGVR